MIGNDIHFHMEHHIVVQVEVLQSQTTGINFEVIMKWVTPPLVLNLRVVC